MDLMQGDDSLAWTVWALVLSVFAVLFVWYMVVTGRDRRKKVQKKGQQKIETYGELQEDHAPLSKFLIWTYIGTGVWALGYLLWTGTHGFF